MAKGIVGGDEIPAVATFAHDGRAGAGRQHPGIIDIVDAGG